MPISALKRLTPMWLKKNLRASRLVAKSLDLDERLKLRRTELEDRHLQNLRVIPHRGRLLEMLPQGGVAAEVGVAEGDFSREILEKLQPNEFHLIDVWESEHKQYSEIAFDKVRRRFAAQIAEGCVQLHRMLSWDGLSKLADASLDFLYIDASHRYEDVCRDLEAALPKIKTDGIIAGHDYITWSSACSRLGVVEAVNEFCIREDFEMILLTAQSNRHLSYALRRIRDTLSTT